MEYLSIVLDLSVNAKKKDFETTIKFGCLPFLLILLKKKLVAEEFLKNIFEGSEIKNLLVEAFLELRSTTPGFFWGAYVENNMHNFFGDKWEISDNFILGRQAF